MRFIKSGKVQMFSGYHLVILLQMFPARHLNIFSIELNSKFCLHINRILIQIQWNEPLEALFDKHFTIVIYSWSE